MSDKGLKVISGLLSLALLVTLILKLQNVPAGMILSGLFLGGLIIIGILLGCIVIASMLKLFFKRSSHFTLYFISTAIVFLYFHYTLYSPTLKIVVPKNFNGEVNLVLSNAKDNILTVDTNGIGYLNQWTFDHTYSAPQVISVNGENIYNRCIGFNPSTFWAKGRACCIAGKQIESLSFEIVPKEKIGQKQYYSKDLTSLVNKSLVKFTESDDHTPTTQTSSVKL